MYPHGCASRGTPEGTPAFWSALEHEEAPYSLGEMRVRRSRLCGLEKLVRNAVEPVQALFPDLVRKAGTPFWKANGFELRKLNAPVVEKKGVRRIKGIGGMVQAVAKERVPCCRKVCPDLVACAFANPASYQHEREIGRQLRSAGKGNLGGGEAMQ